MFCPGPIDNCAWVEKGKLNLSKFSKSSMNRWISRDGEWHLHLGALSKLEGYYFPFAKITDQKEKNNIIGEIRNMIRAEGQKYNTPKNVSFVEMAEAKREMTNLKQQVVALTKSVKKKGSSKTVDKNGSKSKSRGKSRVEELDSDDSDSDSTCVQDVTSLGDSGDDSIDSDFE